MAAPIGSLVCYSDSDSGSNSDEHSDVKGPKKKKRRISTIETTGNTTISKERAEERLPVPAGLRTMFGDKQLMSADPSLHNDMSADLSRHNGRIRSFAHEAGNWATYMFVPYSDSDSLSELRINLFQCIHSLAELQPMEEHHISLSRTVCIRHHWIKPLMDTLRERLKNKPRFFCQISSTKIYTNDEKTRSFLALEIHQGIEHLKSIVKEVDASFKDFRLQEYYTMPSYHVSIGWCVGDITPLVTEALKTDMNNILTAAIEDDPELGVVAVEELHCKTGNKLFQFELVPR